MKLSLIAISTLVLIGLTSVERAIAVEEITVNHRSRPQVVKYDFYMPQGESTTLAPVLICIGGLPIIDGQYITSDPDECLTDVWKQFADENHIAILGVGYLFVTQDWERQESYQYPGVWSGKALIKILDKLSKINKINPRELYMFGISAGAQFSTRFALLNPKRVKAVAAHAAGGYDFPKRYIPVKFLVTVGALDNNEITRLEWANAFVDHAKKMKIDTELKVIPDLAHQQTEEQNELSRQFFANILNNHAK